MATKILRWYTPLDVEAIAALMRAHPDMYVITDTKDPGATGMYWAMKLLRAQLGADRDELCKRIIVQIYREPNLKTVRSVYRFPNIIYTLYMLNTTTTRAVQFAKANDIPVIVFDTTRWSPKFANQIKAAGIASSIHVVNSADKAALFRSYRVRYLFSDVLPGGTLGGIQLFTFGRSIVMPTQMELGPHGE